MIHRLAAWLLGDPELHPAVCTCPFHEGRAVGYQRGHAEGYLRGVTETMALADQDDAFRRFMRACEMPVAAGYPEAES